MDGVTTSLGPMVDGTCTINMATFFLTLVMETITPPGAKVPDPVKLPSSNEYDFIIVGGGTAGCVLANRLSEVGSWRILVLEAGGEEPDITQYPAYAPYFLGPSNINWNYPTEQDPSTCFLGDCSWVSGKGLGGSSALSFMFYVRGNRRDYDGWRDLGNPGWGWNDVLPLFKKSENNLNHDVVDDTEYHATGGFLDVETLPYMDQNVHVIVQALKERGYTERDINGEHQEGVMIAQSESKNGHRRSVNRAFLEPVRRARNGLEVVTYAHVTKVIFNRQRQATGVEFVMETDRTVRSVLACREVILSAGTLGTAQILQLSGIGPQSVLGPLGIPIIRDVPVGQHIQEHVIVPAIQFALNETIQLPGAADTYADDLGRAQNNNGPLRSMGPNSGIAFIKSSLATADEAPDLQLIFTGNYTPSDRRAPDLQIHGTHCQDAHLQLMPGCYYNRIIACPILLRPESRSSLSITSKDPFQPAVIIPNFFTTQKDIQVMRDGLRTVYRLGETKAFKEKGITVVPPQLPGCENYAVDSDELYDCWTHGLQVAVYHTVSSAKMGPASDPTAVVDSKLRVYGVTRLRVIDASIMPTIPSGNTNAPTVMIAEKGANYIKARWTTRLCSILPWPFRSDKTCV